MNRKLPKKTTSVRSENLQFFRFYFTHQVQTESWFMFPKGWFYDVQRKKKIEVAWKHIFEGNSSVGSWITANDIISLDISTGKKVANQN